MYKTLWAGFKLGMILQAAVGAVTLFVFQTAIFSGFCSGVAAAIGVTLSDFACVLAAIWGLGAFLDKSEKRKRFFKYFGAVVLVIFGASIILGVFGINIIPGFSFALKQTSGSAFINAIIITMANPLTIIFWAGVFATRLTEADMGKKDIYVYGIGATLSTLVCMNLVAFAGTLTSSFIPDSLMNVMNIVVGFLLIAFGIKTALK